MKKIFYIAAMTIAASFAASCDYLDEQPYDYLGESQIFEDENKYSLPCFEAYSYMLAGYNCVGSSFLDAATDDAMSTISGSTVHRIARAFITQDTPVYSPWSNCYQGIHQAIFAQNGLMDYATFAAGKTTAQVKEMKDQYYYQMTALRAYYEFTLLQNYGGFPIIDKAYTLSDEGEITDMTRNSFSECVEHIVALCDTAAAHLYNIPMNDANQYGGMTKGAALAIKAKTLTYAASPLYNQSGNTNALIGYTSSDTPTSYPQVADRWKRAAAACMDVINLRTDGTIAAGGTKQYSLITCSSSAKFNTLLFLGDASTAEFIVMKMQAKNYTLENRHYPPSISNTSGGGTVPTQELVNAFCKSDGSTIEAPKDGENTVYTGRDRRFAAYISYNGCKYLTRTIYTRTGDGATADAIGATTDLSTTTGYYMKKFLNETLSWTKEPSTQYHIWPIIRLADIYLLYSEAMVNGYDSYTTDPDALGMTALEAVQAVRKRAGFTAATDKYFTDVTDNAGFIEKLKNERRVELCFEGQRFYDLRRWLDASTVLNQPVHGLETNVSAGVTTYTYFVADPRRAFTDAMYFMPIPKSVLKVNPNIEQNPGY